MNIFFGTQQNVERFNLILNRYANDIFHTLADEMRIISEKTLEQVNFSWIENFSTRRDGKETKCRYNVLIRKTDYKLGDL